MNKEDIHTIGVDFVLWLLSRVDVMQEVHLQQLFNAFFWGDVIVIAYLENKPYAFIRSADKTEAIDLTTEA